MASPFQQQSLRRKIIYIVIILVLSFVTYQVRQSTSFGIDAQAKALELREEDRGEVGLTGSAVRLSLLGSRGLVVCYLWVAAQEHQKRHEWNELELIVGSLTKLEPHYIVPWLFQSWNLAYNVSVESDRIRDKYFYMTRGIQLLADGERQNRNHPDLRFSMGFYNQQKIGMADEANTLRCLYQMSCIDPLDRDPGPNPNNPKALRNADMSINMEQFQRFCERYPMLVRRLREALRYETPRDIVDFLDDNQKLPSRFEEKKTATEIDITQSPLKAPEEQFPVLPPLVRQDEPANPDAPEFDNFWTARDWYKYAVKAVKGPGGRKPRYMADKIFLGYPARGQAYIAEYLEKEGWFDEGWKIRGWFPNDKFANGQDAVAGEGKWAIDAWSKAHYMYTKHGEEDDLYMEPRMMEDQERLAKRYRDKYEITPRGRAVELTPEDQHNPEMVQSFKAHDRLFWYDHNRAMTNFPHFFFVSAVEQLPETVKARKDFFMAEQLRKSGDREPALERYRQAMPEWRDLLLKHKEFRRDDGVQEDTYEVQLKYVGLVREIMGKDLQQVYFTQYYLGQALARSPVILPYPAFSSQSRDIELPVVSPFDGVDEEGVPLIKDDAKDRVRNRLNLPPLEPKEQPAPATTEAKEPAAPPKPGT